MESFSTSCWVSTSHLLFSRSLYIPCRFYPYCECSMIGLICHVLREENYCSSTYFGKLLLAVSATTWLPSFLLSYPFQDKRTPGKWKVFPFLNRLVCRGADWRNLVQLWKKTGARWSAFYVEHLTWCLVLVAPSTAAEKLSKERGQMSLLATKIAPNPKPQYSSDQA